MTHRRRRECACGTVVVADPIDPVPGVRDHVLSEPHRSYSDRTSWSGPREVESTAEPSVVTCPKAHLVRPRRHPRTRTRRYVPGRSVA